MCYYFHGNFEKRKDFIYPIKIADYAQIIKNITYTRGTKMGRLLKKTIGICIILMHSAAPAATKQVPLYGVIQFGAHRPTPPAIVVYWMGKEFKCPVLDTKSSFIIYADTYPNQLHLLITDHPVPGSDQKTHVQYLKVPKGTAYRFFELQQKVEPNPCRGQMTWQIKEKRLDHGGQIPDKTIIVHTRSSFVKTVQENFWKLADNTICLPTIVMKDTITAQEFYDAQIHLDLNRMDLNPIHTKGAHSKKESNVWISF